MKLKSFTYFIGKKKKSIKVEICDTFWKKFSGLMFRKNSPPLLFPFSREKYLSIHSFFCKPFTAIFLDKNKKLIKSVDVLTWKPNISSRGKYLLEIPLI